MSDVVTGEAVVVEVRVARLPTRAVAVLIDAAIQLVTLVVLLVLVNNVAMIGDSALVGALSILVTVLVIVGYPVIFETLTRGRSLGKLALGLRVVSDDGGPVRFRQALFRGLAGMVEFWMFSGAPALITSLVSAKGKRLGDIFAGTIVISERASGGREPQLVMPPQLAGWAAQAELSRLPMDVVATARQYLVRWHELSPQVQHEMGVRIATQTSSYVSPPPPPGVPPHAYLSAVLVERRRREEQRLARLAQQRPAPASHISPYAPQAAGAAPYGTQPPAVPAYPLPAPAPSYGPVDASQGVTGAFAAPGSASEPAARSPYAPPAEEPGNRSRPGETGPTPGGFTPPA